MEKERKEFILGAEKRGIDEKSANKIFDEMSEFAKYAFNKSHAAAYSVVAYETAYLKCHYKEEFMAATMNSFLGNQIKIAEYVNECRNIGTEVLNPDINESQFKFSVVDSKIRFSLDTIKNVSSNAILDIVRIREEGGKFKDFLDFMKRTSSENINKKCVESLIKAGCFNSIEKKYTLLDLLENFETIMDSLAVEARNNYKGQINLFDTSEEKNDIEIVPAKRKLSKKNILDMEKEVLGMYVSGHPLDDYLDIIKKEKAVTSKDIIVSENDEMEYEKISKYDSQEIKICGIVESANIKYTRKNEQMMFATLSDMFSEVEIILFPKIYASYGSFVNVGNVVLVRGKVNITEEEGTKILATEVKKISKTEKIYVKVPKERLNLLPQVEAIIEDISDKYYGNIPVYLFLEGENKMKLLKRDAWLNNEDETINILKLRFGEENVKKK